VLAEWSLAGNTTNPTLVLLPLAPAIFPHAARGVEGC